MVLATTVLDSRDVNTRSSAVSEPVKLAVLIVLTFM